ncbi:PREDICTED: glucose-6-phosphate 1-dehydrogenase 4, chloroplastic isoform X2 [Nicotiana attenuata]|uniref:glucose-6-phosphate 1-dehydrogenase 4, chloroplastic isoform X2 n=1 Tax=Nicotiana attenuata TaxID=49451 RepID=UPI000905A854|nr:PREDICTED: glucose-6-phosphate 1-dehydrogenase 4, chloroplastic isoform X2 [Nicotiana attenuata]
MASLSSVSLSTSSSEISIFPSTNRKLAVLPTAVRTFPTIKKTRTQMINVAHVQPPEVNKPHCSIRSTSFNVEGTGSTTSLDEEVKVDASGMEVSIKLPLFETPSSSTDAETDDSASLSVAVIGATGLLARTKIFPALFALYYSGHLPENTTAKQEEAKKDPTKCCVFVSTLVICSSQAVKNNWRVDEKFGIFGYSRKNLTEDHLRAIIAPTLSCRIDHQENCEEKMDAFLKRIFYLNGGYDNREGMSNLNTLMEEGEGKFGANRIFYLSVPQEALIDVASSLAEKAQTQRGWNRVIIEKPFGLGLFSSHQLTNSLLSDFEEKQLYRIDHLLGRNTIENLAVLRFSNVVFMPLWNRSYIHNIQVTFSEELGMQTSARYPNGYGILGDVVHSHIFQTVALLAMEPPVTLDGEDIRYEKVKVLKSIRKLESSDVILGHYEADSGSNFKDKDNPIPTYFGAVLYVDNARWDGVPFLIKAGRGLKKNRVEIRIQFRRVPGNLYNKDGGHMQNLATNDLILRDVPDEAILVRINNKIPGLGMNLEASELNLLYKDKYNVEITDSYEQLLHDVIDGDNHLFMRSDEVEAAWNVLSPVLSELDNNNVTVERYNFGSKGPDKAGNLWAKHGVQWLDD